MPDTNDIQQTIDRAKAGDAEAQCYLGSIHYFGEGVAQDYVKAVGWWRKAAAQGHAQAQFNLGLAYSQGKGVAQNQAKAVEWWRKAAAQGLAEAQLNLGHAYLFGNGVAQDQAEGVKWTHKAAEQGHAEAQYRLGSAYFFGNGVAQDYVKAVGWWIKAAEQGLAKAQYRLGGAYFFGKGIVQDQAEGIRWWHLAAEQGDAQAQYYLGFAYYFGEGVEQDYGKAVEWRRKAADQGLPQAQFSLGSAYFEGKGVAQDQEEGAKWWHKAAEQNHAEAQYNLGIAYGKGEGVAQNYDKAVGWWRKAAAQGHAQAQYILGFAYHLGKGVAQNQGEAEKWLRLAAEQGSQNALDLLIDTYMQKEEGQMAYAYLCNFAPAFNAISALVYIAHRIEAIDGLDKEGRVVVFEAFFGLYKAAYWIRAKLFCGSAESEVAHYTSLKAMQSLVAPKGQFRLYNADHMNDPTEGRVFFEIMKQPMESRGIADFQTRFYSDIHTASKGPTALSPAYVGSFVPVKKGRDGNKDLLYLWCIHGRQDGVDAGGACLIFDRKKFAETAPSQFGEMHQLVNEPAVFDEKFQFGDGQSAQRSAKPSRPVEPALYRIVYKSDCETELGDELEQLADALKSVEAVLTRIKSPDAPAKLRILVRELLDSIRFLIKSDDYDWEKEVRVVEMRYGVENDNNRAPDGNGIRREVKYYLELGQAFRCHQVIIGSNVDNYSGWESKLKDNAKDVEIRQSNIPLRRR